MKRLISILVTAAMLVTLLAGMTFITSAAEYSGTWGELTWTLDSSGKLVISGKGEMKDFPEYSHEAWQNHNGYIKSVVIKDGITRIGNFAFHNCGNLTSITIPNSVKGIGRLAFFNCSKLTSATIPNSVTGIGTSAFASCSSLTSITIPNSVTSIADYLFQDCNNLTRIKLPDSITNIGSYAFCYCSSLTSINIPNSVTKIGGGAFYGCSNLTSINIPDSITSIGINAFEHCYGLIEKENGIHYLDKWVVGCDFYLDTAVLRNDSIAISDEVFSNYHLKSITIPASIKTIGAGAFENCENLSVYITDLEAWFSIDFKDSSSNPLNYAENIFLNEICITDLDLTIPDNIKIIKDYAFYGYSALKSVNIGSSVTSIGDSAFYGCSGLRSITISDSVTEIGWSAFSDSHFVEKIIYCGTEEQWNNISKGGGWKYNTGIYTINKSYTLQYHKFNDGTITTEPTYDSEGVKTYTCECGETKTETVAKLEKTPETTVETTTTTAATTTDVTAANGTTTTSNDGVNVSVEGCSSSITFGAGLAILAVGAAAITLCKKKEDN